MTFRILTVCTGNICRSPLAEQLLRRELTGVDATLGSAGTDALVGHPMDERAAAYSVELGGDPDGHAARQLTADTLRETELVLVASRRHRRSVVELLPRRSRSSFTIREFARLLDTLNDDDRAEIAAEDDADARLAKLVDIAAINRGVAELPDEPAEDDIVDPFRQHDAVYAASVAQLVPAIRSIGPVLRRASAGFP
ncbi:low molecular weight phosphatase family protein [Leifsonia sp. NPDC080035]|uniref:Low molecular weight phosphatase family protein n=1 Tax=Leifsonia sp. NPDC080035 TaxID=3143936 RepID=A0AAU7GEV9_9MICO